MSGPNPLDFDAQLDAIAAVEAILRDDYAGADSILFADDDLDRLRTLVKALTYLGYALVRSTVGLDRGIELMVRFRAVTLTTPPPDR